MRGDTDERNGNDVFILHIAGSGVQPGFVHDCAFRESALAFADSLAGGPNAVAWFEAFHIRGDFQNCAGKIASDDVRERKLCRNHPAADVDVNWVNVHGGHFDQALGGPRFWSGQVAVNDYVRRTGLLDIGGFHFLSEIVAGETERLKSEVRLLMLVEEFQRLDLARVNGTFATFKVFADEYQLSLRRKDNQIVGRDEKPLPSNHLERVFP